MASYAGDATQGIPTQIGREPEHLHEFFEAQVAARPDHIAIEALGKKMTYAELDRLANRIAHWLRARGIGPGSLVGLCQSKSCNLFASMLGILKAGAGYVPVDTRFPEERIRHIFADAGVGMVITEQRLLATLGPDFCTRTLVVDTQADEIEQMPGSAIPREELAASSICYVIYTSGSTGRPKGVMIAHRNAAAFVTSLPTVYRLTPQDRVYQGFSVAFDASVEEIWGAFSIGGTLVVAPESVARSPLDVAEFITASRVTFFSTVPSFLALIDRDLPTVRLLVLGGEVCMQELVTRWAKGGRRLLNTYGPTETTVVATWTECTAGVPITIGRALPGYHTHVLNEQLQPVGAGEEGELFIGGDGGGAGLSQPAGADGGAVHRRARSLGPGTRLYRTHDLVRLGAGWCAPVPGPDRRPGEDQGLPCRAVRDRDGADAVSRHQGRGRAHGVRRRSAGAGSLRGARRSGYAARPGGRGGDAADQASRLHDPEVPRRRRASPRAHQRQGRPQAAARTAQPAQGHEPGRGGPGERYRVRHGAGLGEVPAGVAGVGRGRLLPGPRAAIRCWRRASSRS